MNTTALCSPVATSSGTDTPRLLLLVSYHFPPVGGAGVQRPVKFVKYLEQSGWETTALVAENPSVPVLDESLCADFPPGLEICRARTLEPGYRFKQSMSAGHPGGGGSAGATGAEAHSASGFRGLKQKLKQKLRRTVKQAASLVLQPDPQILWRPAALKAARRVLREREHHAILATAPPWSNLLLAEQLARETGLPLILDFRDEWDLGSLYLENSQKDRISISVQQRMQRRLLRNADGILATTTASAERLEARCREAGGLARVRCIYNGFDADDFRQLAVCCSQQRRPASGGTFRLAYTGTLWNLTSIEPLVQAVELLSLRHPELVARLELLITGRKTPEQQELLGRLKPMGCRLVLQDYCSHTEALSHMTTADGLCLLLSDVPGAERVVPAKLFEYLAAGRELLAIVPEGETARLVRGIHPASHLLPADVEGICSWLAAQIASVETDRKSWQPDSLDRPEIRQFSREQETGQLAELLNETVSSRRRASGG